jgi:hypothetical protein
VRDLSKHMKTKWVLVGLVVAAGIATASTAIGRGRPTANASNPAADVLSRIASSRLTAATVAGGTVSIEARASERGADSSRSLWYATLAGAALAQNAGATSVSRHVLDSTGAQLDTETDAVANGGPSAFGPTDRSAADVVADARARAESVGARLVSAHYIRLYGGTAELVVRPADPLGFVRSGGANVGALLGDLASNQRPYLVTVVDGQSKPILVLGFTPAVGGSIGQGIGWNAPQAETDAIWGAAKPSHRLP